MNITSTSPSALRVLVGDDDGDVRLSARFLLEAEGCRVHLAASIAEIVQCVRQQEIDVALLDMNYTRDTTSGWEGVELLDSLASIDPDLPVIVMTAWGNIDLAVEAMQHGARDFVQKPWSNERLLRQVRQHGRISRSLRRGRLLEEENRLLRGEVSQTGFIGRAPAMQQVWEVLQQVGPSDAAVLILGENGSGKGEVARLLHQYSLRKAGPFVSVNMGGLSEFLFESELFGHVKGAFTDAKSDRPGRCELAGGGTLFLDEIGNLGFNQQSKLLRLLETGEFERVGSSRTCHADIRIVSATNVDLPAAVQQGHFREDLYYRLNTVTVTLPPLRHRKEDLEALVQQFLSRHNRKYKKQIADLSPAAWQVLREHSWPGNIRELDHALERAVLLCGDPLIGPRHLSIQPDHRESPDLGHATLAEVEKYMIARALERHSGNIMEAARHLGLSRATLYRRLQDDPAS